MILNIKATNSFNVVALYSAQEAVRKLKLDSLFCSFNVSIGFFFFFDADVLNPFLCRKALNAIGKTVSTIGKGGRL